MYLGSLLPSIAGDPESDLGRIRTKFGERSRRVMGLGGFEWRGGGGESLSQTATGYNEMESQTAVTAYFSSEQLLLFALALYTCQASNLEAVMY